VNTSSKQSGVSVKTGRLDLVQLVAVDGVQSLSVQSNKFPTHMTRLEKKHACCSPSPPDPRTNTPIAAHGQVVQVAEKVWRPTSRFLRKESERKAKKSVKARNFG
jgi:hypothetical protein